MQEFYTADAWIELPKFAESLSWDFTFIIADPLYNLEDSEKDTLDSLFLSIASNGYVAFSHPDNPFLDDYRDVDHQYFWVKPLSTKNYKAMKNPSKFVELVQYHQVHPNPKCRIWNGKEYHWAMSTNVLNDIVQEGKLNADGWRKPLSLIKRLIKLYTNPGDTILDPFAGSGVVAEACLELDRGFVAFDINPLYVLEARERLGLNG